MSRTIRRPSRRVLVGPVPLGDGAPLSIQTMTKAPAGDVEAAGEQIRAAAAAGCDIVRVAVPNVESAESFGRIVEASPIPVVADIHFDWRIALSAIDAGADKIRVNPGNMPENGGLERVVEAAGKRGIPIRVGVNSGSVKHKDPSDCRPVAELMVAEALRWAEYIESLGFRDIVLSLKSGDAMETITANRLVASRCDYPLHLGVTAAGPREVALVKSALGIGALLADGIGDTIRLSFTGPPVDEVHAARELLAAAGLRDNGPVLLSCPTCGRCRVDLPELVETVRRRLAGIDVPLTVAVMGCEVNGPGEAREADVGIASAGKRITLFVAGSPVRTLPAEEAVDALLREVERLAAERGKVQ